MSDHCSFCQRSRSEVTVLIASRVSGAMICDGCCTFVATPAARIAFCSSCTVIDGKHAGDCPDVAEAS